MNETLHHYAWQAAGRLRKGLFSLFEDLHQFRMLRLQRLGLTPHCARVDGGKGERANEKNTL